MFFDLHAGGPPEGDVPGSCSAADLTPDEKLLEYQLSDDSICVHLRQFLKSRQIAR